MEIAKITWGGGNRRGLDGLEVAEVGRGHVRDSSKWSLTAGIPPKPFRLRATML